MQFLYSGKFLNKSDIITFLKWKISSLANKNYTSQEIKQFIDDLFLFDRIKPNELEWIKKQINEILKNIDKC